MSVLDSSNVPVSSDSYFSSYIYHYTVICYNTGIVSKIIILILMVICIGKLC